MLYTLAEARGYLNQALEARIKALAAQAYGAGAQNVTRAQLDAINRDIARWEGVISAMENAKKGTMRRVVVTDR